LIGTGGEIRRGKLRLILGTLANAEPANGAAQADDAGDRDARLPAESQRIADQRCGNRRDEANAVFIRNIGQAADKAARHGILVLLEAINPRDKPGYFYSTVGEVADLMKQIARPNVRMMFDVYHVGVAEGDILTKLERHLPDIGHVQIAAVPSRAEPDEGEVAYRAIFEALDDLGYAGWVGCEYKPRGDTREGLRWTEALGVSL